MEIGEFDGESSHPPVLGKESLANPRFQNSRPTMQKQSGASGTERKKTPTTT
jgi:hypothetical protein